MSKSPTVECETAKCNMDLKYSSQLGKKPMVGCSFTFHRSELKNSSDFSDGLSNTA